MRILIKGPKPGTIAYELTFHRKDPELERAIDYVIAIETDADATPEDANHAKLAYNQAFKRAILRRHRERQSRCFLRVRAQPRILSPSVLSVRTRSRASHRQTPAPKPKPSGGDDSDGPQPFSLPPPLPFHSRQSRPLPPPAYIDPLDSFPVRFLEGDAFDKLVTILPGSLDGAITDPPHGVLDQPWDVRPSVDVWREVLRTLKPGAPLLAIGAPQTFDMMVADIRAAGFEVEDMAIWAFATGRPPSERRLKRAHAPIVIARKPGPKLPLNINEARIPFRDEADKEQTRRSDTLRAHGVRRAGVYDSTLDSNQSEMAAFEPKDGRWPANLILTDPVGESCDKFFQTPVVRDRNGHPAAKPVQLLTQLARAFIPPGGTVLDPFAGGGSLGVAAIATGRKAILIERDPTFYAMAKAAVERASQGDFGGTNPESNESIQEIPKEIPILSAPVRLATSNNTSNNEDLANISDLAGVSERANVANAPNLLTPQEMATRLGVSTRTLRRGVRLHGWPCVRLGARAVRFDPIKVLEVMTQKGTSKDVVLPGSEDRNLGCSDSEDSTGRTKDPTLPTHPRNKGKRQGTRKAIAQGFGIRSASDRGNPSPGDREEGSREASRDRAHSDSQIQRTKDAADVARVFGRAVGKPRGRGPGGNNA